MMNLHAAILCLAAAALVAPAQAQTDRKVKTTFQTSREWRPTIDNRADAVMVYGVGGNPSDKDGNRNFEYRVRSWRDRGYTVHFMTGIAWGEYKDYFTGEWDGRPHLDEGQVQRSGDTIWHGHLVPYIVPTDNYLTYMKERHVKRVIDAGIDAIFMEEPEFWAARVTARPSKGNGKSTTAPSGAPSTNRPRTPTWPTSSSTSSTTMPCARSSPSPRSMAAARGWM